jgi:hypothetical protein
MTTATAPAPATSTTAAKAKAELSTGEAARLLDLAGWQIVRLFRRGLVGEPARVGRYRVIRRADLPKLRAAAIAAGYLPTDAAGQPAGDA